LQIPRVVRVSRYGGAVNDNGVSRNLASWDQPRAILCGPVPASAEDVAEVDRFTAMLADPEGWAAAACASSCRWQACTGRGDSQRWAHQCRHAPAPELPPCGIVDCGRPGVGRYLPGVRCLEHAPAQPQRRPPVVPSPVHRANVYGNRRPPWHEHRAGVKCPGADECPGYGNPESPHRGAR
jgi:hypothetical protein